eukprot:25204_1
MAQIDTDRVDLIIRCPSKKCKNGKSEESQWVKSNCSHKAKIDSDCRISCENWCSWGSSDKIDIMDVTWNCSKCQCCSKANSEQIAASLMKAVAKLSRALDDASKERRNVYAMVMDSLSDRL